MKSIIFNNNNNNNNGYWKKQAMLVNMLALSIIVLLLMIEQVNTKEVEINVDLKDEASKDTAKGEKVADSAQPKLKHLAQDDDKLTPEEKRQVERAATGFVLFVFVVGALCCSSCFGAIVYFVVRAAKN